MDFSTKAKQRYVVPRSIVAKLDSRHVIRQRRISMPVLSVRAIVRAATVTKHVLGSTLASRAVSCASVLLVGALLVKLQGHLPPPCTQRMLCGDAICRGAALAVSAIR